MTLEKLQYPIGKFIKPSSLVKEDFLHHIQDISEFPQKLNAAVKNISEQELNTPYRPGGWTVRQVIHHCADSHMNGLIRLKLTLTEDQPIIKPYAEAKWADLPDGKHLPIATSLQIIEGVHQRWYHLLQQLPETDLHKSYFHPQYGKTYTLYQQTALYAWHAKHHLAHVCLVTGK